MGLFGGGSKTSSTTQGVSREALPFLQRGFAESQRLLDQGPQVFQGERVAGFAPETEEAFQGTAQRARSNQGFLDDALSQLGQTAEGRDYVPPEILDLIQSGGLQASNQALGSVNQAFQGSGFGSPLHSILGSRAAGEAIGNTSIPALSNLFTNQQNRQESAIRDLPGLYNQATTGQGDILRGIGAEREGLQQRRLDADKARFDERVIGEQFGADQFINRTSGLGQFFRTSKGKTPKKGLFGTIAPIAGALIGGYFGGPAGAQAGASIGGAAGEAAS